MGDAVIDLLFVRISFSITLTDTFGDNARVAFSVASVLAVLALHACRILEEVSAKGAAHDVVELVLDKLVSVHLVNLLLALTNSTHTTETLQVDGAASVVLLEESQG